MEHSGKDAPVKLFCWAFKFQIHISGNVALLFPNTKTKK